MSERTVDAFDFSNEISNTQYNKITAMIDRAYDKSGVRQIGESRHDDKLQAVANGASNSHEIMQSTGVHSWATEHKVKGQMHIFAEYCKVNHNTRELTGIKPNVITGFLEQMSDRGYSQKTFDSYCSTLERFAVIFDKAYPDNSNRAETWHSAISEAREELRDSFVQLNTGTRAYNDPQAIVAGLTDDACRMAGMLQLNHGLRLSDACKLQEIRDMGLVAHSKGGQPINNLYSKLSTEEKNLLNSLKPEDFKGLRERYQHDLKESALNLGENYNGTHGLRHNYAQQQYNGYIESGCTPREALLRTAEDMGHHRPDITLQYLR